MLRNPSIPCISCISWLQSPSSPIQTPDGTLTRPALWLKPLHSHFILHNSSFSLPHLPLPLASLRLCVRTSSSSRSIRGFPSPTQAQPSADKKTTAEAADSSPFSCFPCISWSLPLHPSSFIIHPSHFPPSPSSLGVFASLRENLFFFPIVAGASRSVVKPSSLPLHPS